ncbi:sugar transferase [Sphingomonas sp. Root710]|uniref:sugar transferase n=1 Tax=Sphingomonas sp. Root710 TaxID=1736594 RepID=UPI0006FFF026|nr:sugar transferase [Sphingomonas sp. Root710]KRB82871.1 sugar transferase [Sphingomonas sp. Root710]
MIREPKMRQMRVSALNALSAQFLIGFCGAILFPAFIRYGDFDTALKSSGFPCSFVGASVAIALAILMLRRVTAYPGTRTFGYILPSFIGAFGLVLAVLFALRLEYGRIYFASTFVASIAIFFILSIYLNPRTRRRFYVVPGFDMEGLTLPDDVEWLRMRSPAVPEDRSAFIVADFRRDHPADWERMLAEAAVQGHTVFHSKQVLESLTGRVSIEHLSENNFGSLLPNLAWRKAKRVIDLLSAILILPLLCPLFLIVGLWIKLDSPGPIFFCQTRIGAGGQRFRIVKFRTMRQAAQKSETDPEAAMTRDNDERITRAGRWLRRNRIDELPQIFNIIRGEMSWIGPRPEVESLSKWYDAEIPFYIYRHIVRPGITGWAQVNQGHVTDIPAVDRKLQYDFYYIKNFSLWIDILIALRTAKIAVTGFGAR